MKRFIPILLCAAAILCGCSKDEPKVKDYVTMYRIIKTPYTNASYQLRLFSILKNHDAFVKTEEIENLKQSDLPQWVVPTPPIRLPNNTDYISFEVCSKQSGQSSYWTDIREDIPRKNLKVLSSHTLEIDGYAIEIRIQHESDWIY